MCIYIVIFEYIYSKTHIYIYTEKYTNIFIWGYFKIAFYIFGIRNIYICVSMFKYMYLYALFYKTSLIKKVTTTLLCEHSW